MQSQRWPIIFICLAWATAIYMMSGTSVSTEALFTWLREKVFQDEASFNKFLQIYYATWGPITKVLHFGEFAILMLLVTWVIDRLSGSRRYRSILIAGVLCLAYAASDEWHQMFVPGRNPGVGDFAADALGILAMGSYLFLARRGEHPNKEPRPGSHEHG